MLPRIPLALLAGILLGASTASAVAGPAIPVTRLAATARDGQVFLTCARPIRRPEPP